MIIDTENIPAPAGPPQNRRPHPATSEPAVFARPLSGQMPKWMCSGGVFFHPLAAAAASSDPCAILLQSYLESPSMLICCHLARTPSKMIHYGEQQESRRLVWRRPISVICLLHVEKTGSGMHHCRPIRHPISEQRENTSMVVASAGCHSLPQRHTPPECPQWA